MTRGLALYGPAAIALAALFIPAHSSAKGLLGAPLHTGGAFRFHLHRQANGFLHRQGHGHRDHRRNSYADGYGSGYGYGEGYWPLGYDYGRAAPQEVVVPVAYPLYAGPRCEHSVETVVVPSEEGGERKIRITRC